MEQMGEGGTAPPQASRGENSVRILMPTLTVLGILTIILATSFFLFYPSRAGAVEEKGASVANEATLAEAPTPAYDVEEWLQKKPDYPLLEERKESEPTPFVVRSAQELSPEEKGAMPDRHSSSIQDSPGTVSPPTGTLSSSKKKSDAPSATLGTKTSRALREAPSSPAERKSTLPPRATPKPHRNPIVPQPYPVVKPGTLPRPPRPRKARVQKSVPTSLYWIQVGSYPSYVRALGLKVKLDEQGIHTAIHVKKVAGRVYYRVSFGAFTSESEARAYVERFRKISFLRGSYVTRSL